jgi:hypothetical protein
MAVPPGVESRRSEGQYQHGIVGHVTSSSVRSSTSESLPLSSIEVAINRAAARRCAKVAGGARWRRKCVMGRCGSDVAWSVSRPVSPWPFRSRPLCRSQPSTPGFDVPAGTPNLQASSASVYD